MTLLGVRTVPLRVVLVCVNRRCASSGMQHTQVAQISSAQAFSTSGQQFLCLSRPSGTATASLKCVFGGAWSPSSPVCRCGDATLGSSSEQRVGRVAEYARDEGQQQRFWAALIVLTTALSARPVRRLEICEHSLTSRVDICRSLNPCSRTNLYLRSSDAP